MLPSKMRAAKMRAGAAWQNVPASASGHYPLEGSARWLAHEVDRAQAADGDQARPEGRAVLRSLGEGGAAQHDERPREADDAEAQRDQEALAPTDSLRGARSEPPAAPAHFVDQAHERQHAEQRGQ